ncbi:MAG: Mut7-C RNAse domain-containing protein [Acidobacteriia bacterium]|nr:Mut7-C RNAse domain-containing protein [Terriglobia bacterium]
MSDLKFACDAMLGRLARWLRLAGFDVSYTPDLHDLMLAGKARAEERWLLTCDRRLAGLAGPRSLLLRARTTERQIAELRTRLPMTAQSHLFLTRCSHCNSPLEAVSCETVRDRVPPYVATHADRFVACRNCGRVYWPGTHVGRIVSTLEAWFLP